MVDALMAMRHGLSQCWWLSSTCEVNWNAWAAIATAVAAVVALGVGLAPIFTARRQRRRIARAEARVAAADLKMQALHVAAGLHLIAGAKVPAYIYRLAVAQFAMLNVEGCLRVVPYLDVLHSDLEVALSEAIADIGIGVRVLSRLAIDDAAGPVDGIGARELYADLLESLEKARRALYVATGSEHAGEALEPAAKEFAEKLREEARARVVAEVTAGRHTR